MRFGIMSMQLNSLVPRDLPPEKLMEHIAGFDLSNLVRRLAAPGFNPIELGGDLVLFLPHTLGSESIEDLATLKTDLALSYTVHLPLWSVEPSTPLSPVRLGSVKALVDAIQATQTLNPEAYVLHATGSLAAEFYRMRIPDLARSLILRQFQNNARESIRFILSETGLESRKLAIETIEFPFELTLELAEEMDTSICFDTGHVLVGFSGPVDLFEALASCLPRLANIHLHDGPWQGPDQVIGYGKDHQPLGACDLDVGHFLDSLDEADYNGPIIFELSLEEALASMDVIRSIRPEFAP